MSKILAYRIGSFSVLVILVLLVFLAGCKPKKQTEQEVVTVLPPPFSETVIKADPTTWTPAMLAGRCLVLSCSDTSDQARVLSLLNDGIGGAVRLTGAFQNWTAFADSISKFPNPPLLIWETQQAVASSLPAPGLAVYSGDSLASARYLSGYFSNFSKNNAGAHLLFDWERSVPGKDLQSAKSMANMITHTHDAGVLALASGFGDFYKDFDIRLNGEDSVDQQSRRQWTSPYRSLVSSGLGLWKLNSDALFLPLAEGERAYHPGRVTKELIRDETGFAGILYVQFEGASLSSEEALAKVSDRMQRAMYGGTDGFLAEEEAQKLAEKLGALMTSEQGGTKILMESARKWLQAAAWQQAQDNAQVLNQRYAQDFLRSTVLLTDEQESIPVGDFAQGSGAVATLALGPSEITDFQKAVVRYCSASNFVLPNAELAHAVPAYTSMLEAFELIIVQLTVPIPERTAMLLDALAANHRLIVVKPAWVSLELGDATIINLPDLAPLAWTHAAEGIFGAAAFSGRMHVDQFALQAGTGQSQQSLIRMGSKRPVQDQSFIRQDQLTEIDSLIAELLEAQGASGAQVAVVQKGHLIYEQAFGYHSFRKIKPVGREDVFDLASVTKMAVTTMLAMHYQSNGQLDLTARVDQYLPDAKGKSVGALSLKSLLQHRSGLPASLPISIYIDPARRRNARKPRLYAASKEGNYSLKIATGRYLDNRVPDEIRKAVLDSKAAKSGTFRYSDLGFVLMGMVLEEVGDASLNVQFAQIFHTKELSALEFGSSKDRDAVPTSDNDFRKTRLDGHVHDPIAALLGGTAGHAGLFGNARSLAALGDLILKEGTYADAQYFNSETLHLFADQQIGFRLAPYSGFGHTGFTGTACWINPEKELVAIILTNRLAGGGKDSKLADLQVRERIWEHLQLCLR